MGATIEITNYPATKERVAQPNNSAHVKVWILTYTSLSLHHTLKSRATN